MPVYNKEKFLRRSLDSIVKLSRFDEFEVIIVDDGSTDNSAAIIKEYCDKYDNMQLIAFDKGSGSPSKPRNTGIAKSTTDYLIFMDPDDEIINDGYSVLLSAMEKYDSDIIIATRIGVTESGVKTFTDFIDEDFTYVNSNEYSYKKDLLDRRPYILKTIYKKSIIVDNNIVFNEKIRTSEDRCFDVACMAYATKMTKINDIVYKYTAEAEGSITTSVPMKIYEELYDVLDSIYKSYTLAFDEETTMHYIVLLLNYYFNRISFLKDIEDVNTACDLFCGAVEKFGCDRFSVLTDPEEKEFIEAIRNRDLQERLCISYIKRIKTIEKRSRKKIEKQEKEIAKLKKLHNRKLVKAGIFLAKKIGK